MKINQLSVFLENKPGQLSEPCRVLADAGINIQMISTSEIKISCVVDEARGEEHQAEQQAQNGAA